MSDTPSTVPVTLVKGSDEGVRRDAVRALVGDLVGTEDHGLAVEEVEVGAPGDDGDPIIGLVDAAQTPPFLTGHRVVLGRVTEKRERAELVAPVVGYLADPLPSTRLVLDWGGGKVPRSLTEAIAQVGGAVVDTSPGHKLSAWVPEQLAEATVKLDKAGQARLVDWLGDEPGRLHGLLQVLISTFGPGARLGLADVEPFLGDGGGVPPWDLTDAIDRGDRPGAIQLLHRMLAGRHPFQILATLHTHYSRMLQLDGAQVGGERAAADLLGMKGSTFPARKALGQARRLGHDRIVRAVDLLAQADLDLRGAKAWPGELVLEVLVARLATLSR